MTRLLTAVVLMALSVSSTATGSATVGEPALRASIDSTPSWVDTTLLHGAPALNATVGEPLTYAGFEWQLRIGTDSFEQYFRAVSIPRTSEGVSRATEFSIDYAPAYQSLVLHEITISRPGSRTNRLAPDIVRLLQREEDLDRRLYSGVVSATAVLRDIRVGDTLSYSYTLRGRNPVLGPRYAGLFPLGWPQRVGRTALRVLAPQSRPLESRLFRISVPGQRRTANGVTEYRWFADTVPPVSYEEGCPPWHNPLPRIQLSEFGGWKDVVQWATSLYQSVDTVSPALDSLVRLWGSQGALDNAVQSAIAFVQDDIRYLGIEMGVNSHQPSSPQEVIERRFGDCKDKSLLLCHALRRLGVKAWPALVSMSNGPDVASMLAAPPAFDHVVVAVDLGGVRYWIDPTVQHQCGPLALRSSPDLGVALVVDKRTRDLETMRRPPGYVNTIDVDERWDVAAYDQPARLTVISRHRGAMAEIQRAYFAQVTRGEIDRDYLEFYARRFPGTTLDSTVNLVDDTVTNTLTIREHYVVPGFCDIRKGRLYVTVHGSAIAAYAQPPSSPSGRALPLMLEHPLDITQRSTVRFPADIGLDLQDSDTVRVDDGVVRYTVDAAYQERTLVVDFGYTTRRQVLSADMVPAYAQTLTEIDENASYTIWVPFSDTNTSEVLVRRLVKRLRQLGKDL